MKTYYTIGMDERIGGAAFYWIVRPTLENPIDNPRVFKTRKQAQAEADKRNEH
jgi:hypothetical protein